MIESNFPKYFAATCSTEPVKSLGNLEKINMNQVQYKTKIVPIIMAVIMGGIGTFGLQNIDWKRLFKQKIGFVKDADKLKKELAKPNAEWAAIYDADEFESIQTFNIAATRNFVLELNNRFIALEAKIKLLSLGDPNED